MPHERVSLFSAVRDRSIALYRAANFGAAKMISETVNLVSRKKSSIPTTMAHTTTRRHAVSERRQDETLLFTVIRASLGLCTCVLKFHPRTLFRGTGRGRLKRPRHARLEVSS